MTKFQDSCRVIIFSKIYFKYTCSNLVPLFPLSQLLKFYFYHACFIKLYIHIQLLIYYLQCTINYYNSYTPRRTKTFHLNVRPSQLVNAGRSQDGRPHIQNQKDTNNKIEPSNGHLVGLKRFWSINPQSSPR
jgi:hypothetical protein